MSYLPDQISPFARAVDGLVWRWNGWQKNRQLELWRQRERRENRLEYKQSPSILFVSEGDQQDHFYRCLLEWMAVNRPQLREHVRLDRLPCNLDDHDDVALFHAWVQDPVRERDPKLWSHLQQLEYDLNSRGAQIVQPSEVLSNSERVTMMQRLNGVGARVPVTVAVGSDFQQTLGGLSLPIIVRPCFGHGDGMQLLKTKVDLDGWWLQVKRDLSQWVAIEYIDVRNADGYYRKCRYLVVGDAGLPRHLMMSKNWEVRPEDRIRNADAREEELLFLAKPVVEASIFDAAAKALQFDVAAFDYSYDADGALVIWEANPYPDISLPEAAHPSRSIFVERSWALYCDYYAERAGINA